MCVCIMHTVVMRIMLYTLELQQQMLALGNTPS